MIKKALGRRRVRIPCHEHRPYSCTSSVDPPAYSTIPCTQSSVLSRLAVIVLHVPVLVFLSRSLPASAVGLGAHIDLALALLAQHARVPSPLARKSLG